MNSDSFAHLHLHSEYSLLDGACRVADIPVIAKKHGHTAVALTDHGVLYGVVNFYKACKSEGIKPIIGCEVYVAPGSRFDKSAGKAAKNYHLVLLAENETGYRNLIKLTSLAYTEGFYSKPRVDIDLLREYHEGLICLSACLAGFIPRAVIAGDEEGAAEYAKLLLSIFGKDNFFLEIQDHGLADQDRVNESLVRISDDLSIPLVATNDVHYIEKENARDQEILLCIGTGSVLSEGRPIGFETDEFYYKSTEEMAELFRDFNDAVENAGRIAERCNVELEFGKTYLPSFNPENGMSPSEYLRQLAYSGFDEKKKNGTIIFDGFHTENEYLERIEYELSVIDRMGYDEYYLIVRDYVNFAKMRDIPVGPGRGSGAGSLVAFLTGITDIDSIKYDLIFERFLNPERVSMPDFDIDFCYNRRDEVIDYVKNKYGYDRVCQIVTFGTLAARAAIKDVGRALGIPYADIDRIVREIPRELDITIKNALDKSSTLREIYENDSVGRNILDLAMRIEGMPRHASTHAAGVVITEKPVTEYVPVALTGGTVVTQYTMDALAELGILKFDFLALRYLTIINETEKLIRAGDPDFDVSFVELDDSPTYDLISSGRTDGVFQLESIGMKRLLTRLEPNCFDDIIAAIALFRPGPMDSIPRYIEARKDPSKIKYTIPGIGKILESTYGCIVYQEQVMQIFREIAGYSFTHADVVRKAISKKEETVLKTEHEAFISGAVAKGASEEEAEILFSDIVSFAKYAFNKSHATAYSVLSYRTAYLKTHYPLEYYCALLTSVLGSEEKTAEYISEINKYGIVVLPPNVNRSFSSFSVEDGKIRFGMATLKNVGPQFIDALVNERENNGEFKNVEDFIFRSKRFNINRKQLETLIKSGSLDCLGVKRSQLIDSFEKLSEMISNSRKLDGQIDLFSTSPEEAPELLKISFSDIPELSSKEKLSFEKETSGLYLSGHILDDFSENIDQIKPINIKDIISAFSADEDVRSNSFIGSGFEQSEDSKIFDNQKVTVIGVVASRTVKKTKRGTLISFVNLEDKTGSIEIIMFSGTIERFGYLLTPDSVVSVVGNITLKDSGDPKIILSEAVPLADNDHFKKGSETTNETDRLKENKRIFIRVPSFTDSLYYRASAFVDIFEGDSPVIFYDSSKKEYDKNEIRFFDANQFTVSELKRLLGDDNVVIK